jgi:hypothetical protein
MSAIIHMVNKILRKWPLVMLLCFVLGYPNKANDH